MESLYFYIDVLGMPAGAPLLARALLDRLHGAQIVCYGPAAFLRKWPVDARLERVHTCTTVVGGHHADIAFDLGRRVERGGEMRPARAVLVSRQPGLRALARRLGWDGHAQLTEALVQELAGGPYPTCYELVAVYCQLAQWCDGEGVHIEAYAREVLRAFPSIDNRALRHELYGSCRFSRIAVRLGLRMSGNYIVGHG